VTIPERFEHFVHHHCNVFNYTEEQSAYIAIFFCSNDSERLMLQSAETIEVQRVQHGLGQAESVARSMVSSKEIQSKFIIDE